jgi:hypothetical protein
MGKAHHGLPFCRQAGTVGLFVTAPNVGELGRWGYPSSPHRHHAAILYVLGHECQYVAEHVLTLMILVRILWLWKKTS